MPADLSLPSPAPFRHLLRVRYPECDAQGIAFNARYGDWTDLSTTELLRAIDPAWLVAPGFEYRLRAQSTEWIAPARFDDVLEAAPAVVETGRTSFQVETTYRRLADGLLLARARTTYVRVHGERGTPQPLTETERAGLTRGAPGVVTDHAGVGGGRVTGVVGAADRRTMPWKNGGGVTHELWREGEGAAGFALRVSIAEVAADGPFSRFPGVDRVIALLEGRGMTLTRADGTVVRLDTPGAPFAFAGEDDWTGALVDGPTLDVNVMTDRATRRAVVEPLGPGVVPAGLVFALGTGTLAGAPVERFGLARLDGPALATMAVLSIRVYSVGMSAP